VLACFIVYEAIRWLVSPPNVEAQLMLAVALICIVVNVAATWTLARVKPQSLKSRAPSST
jgi:cobalt-zinc-cadmium efflux system protein